MVGSHRHRRHSICSVFHELLHTFRELLCFVVICNVRFYPYLSGLLHWHWGNRMTDPVSVKQARWIWSKITHALIRKTWYMMTSSNGNIFRFTGHLCGEFTGHRWIPHTNASDAELWCFLCSKRLSKQSWGWWFETPSRSLWRQCNDNPSETMRNKAACIFYGVYCVYQPVYCLCYVCDL